MEHFLKNKLSESMLDHSSALAVTNLGQDVIDSVTARCLVDQMVREKAGPLLDT
jgi:hypothetical protein